MKTFAFYGKGGIGKSTVTTNVAAALSEQGYKVMVIGCDPKADCTRNLHAETRIKPFLDFIKERVGMEMEFADLSALRDVSCSELLKEKVVVKGSRGVICIELGGPEPGVGCAGRGIIVGVDLLKQLGVFEEFSPDIVLFDVLGDVVCGGLALPLRRGLAQQVFIVTSSEYLSLHAANNLCKAIARFAPQGGSKLGGLIYNARGQLDRPELVEEFAKRIGSKLLCKIPRSPLIPEAEVRGKTVLDHAPSSDIAALFRDLAQTLLLNKEAATPMPLSLDELQKLFKSISKAAQAT